jgi:hypothetical protein
MIQENAVKHIRLCHRSRVFSDRQQGEARSPNIGGPNKMQQRLRIERLSFQIERMLLDCKRTRYPSGA